MSTFLPCVSALVALNCGLGAYAEPLECDDLRGPNSMFGEGVKLPRPVGGWNMDCLDKQKAMRSPRADAYRHALVLWESDSGTALSRARAVNGGAQEKGFVPAFEVPAHTYLAGRSTSSFAVAWQLVEDGLFPEWGAVLASCQTEGRGQLRRPWHSPRGNLHVTFRLPSVPLFRGDRAALATGYLLVKAFAALGYSLTLKWPNDLMLEERYKIGGILLEERAGIVLAGVGINLVEAPPPVLLRNSGATPAAVLLPDMKEVVPKGVAEEGGAEGLLAPFSLWRSLVSEAILEYSRMALGNSQSIVLAALDPLLAWKGKKVFVTDGNEAMIEGHFLGLGPGGGMHLLLQDGQMREVFSGSLSLFA